MSYSTHSVMREAGNDGLPTAHNVLAAPDGLAQRRRMRAATIAALPYYDLEAPWVQTPLLRQRARHMYLRMRNTFQLLQSYGEKLVWWLGLDERGYDDEKGRRRGRRERELKQMYRNEAERDDELYESRMMQLLSSRKSEGNDDVEGNVGTSGVVTVLDRNLSDTGKDRVMDRNDLGGTSSSYGVSKEMSDLRIPAAGESAHLRIPTGFPIDELPKEIVR